MTATARAAQQECFRSAAEAAAQTGVRDRDGYRLEALRRDPLEGVNWATVRSCGHPEWPALLLLAGHDHARPVTASAITPTAVWSAAVLRAGTQVTFVINDGMARIEMQAVALANGVVGDKIKVRMLSSTSGEEHVAEGVIRDRTLVEVAQ